MPSDMGSWNTEKELSFLNELASREHLEFGRSRQGRNKIVDCERALAGYTAAFETRANWQKIDRRAIREWLARHKDSRTMTDPLLAQARVLDGEYAGDHPRKESETPYVLLNPA